MTIKIDMETHLAFLEGEKIEKIDITEYDDQELSLIINNDAHLYNLMHMNPVNFLGTILKLFKKRKEQIQIVVDEMGLGEE